MSRSSMPGIIMPAAGTAAATAAVAWAIGRAYDSRRGVRAHSVPDALESWDGEGGALAPQHLAVEAFQAPL